MRSFRHYYDKLIDTVFFHQKSKNNIPVYVFNMGKVGSSSIYNSLKDKYPGLVLHGHSFSNAHSSLIIRRLFRYYRRGGKIKLIASTREPFERSISAFFQNFKRDVKLSFKKTEGYSLYKYIELFFERYDQDSPLNWFDNQIKENFGIDVYQESFPQKGWKVYNNNNIELLVLRSELEDEIKEKIIKDFVSLPYFRLRRSNIANEKEYNEVYRKVKSEISFPDDVIEKLANSKYFKHFYDEEFINIIVQKWSKNK